MNKNNRVLFYSSVKDVNLLLITGFYSTDIRILTDLGYCVQLTNSFFDYLKFWKYDIAFIYFWSKGLIPAVFSKFFSKRLFFTGGIDRLDKTYNKSKYDYLIRKIIFKLCATLSDANIIVSRSDMKNVRESGPLVSNLYYLPHVIEFDKYSYRNNHKENIISTVVWMEDKENVVRKGADKLLYVFHEYLQLGSELSIQIIGSIGEGTTYLQKIATDLSIEDKVIFTGRISEDEKIQRLKASKYYFQLSLYEGFGIAAIEALAAGNIVIHSGRGGLADAINSSGILIDDIADYSSIARRLFEIETDYSSYSNFIASGVKHVSDNFSYNVRKIGIANIIKEITTKQIYNIVQK